MRAKSFLASGALLLSMVAIGSAKTWDIVVDSATRAGNVVLPAGNYRVKLNNNQAEFKTDEGKTYTVPVKVEQTPQKYDQTAVLTKNAGGDQVIQAINLEGTHETLEFSE